MYQDCPCCGTKLAKCYRCGTEWVPRKNKKPGRCVKYECKTPYWDVPRKGQRPHKFKCKKAHRNDQVSKNT